MRGPVMESDPGSPPSGRGQDPPWEPAEFVNEMNETRWQPRSGNDRLWHTAAGLRWRDMGTGLDPKLYRNRLRAYRVGKRRFRKSASNSWSELQTGGAMRITYNAGDGLDRDPRGDARGSGWRQSDHDEEVHK